MASFGGRPSSFFVFCFGDFAKKLSIPTAFAHEHRDFLRQAWIDLTTVSNQSWEVKIKNINGDFFFTDGWSDFVKENDLVEMKLLVFHIHGDSTLKVSIFGHDSCLELANPRAKARPWAFVKTLKKYNITDQRMDLPKHFAMGTGIWRSLALQLEDEKGRRWPIKVTDRNLSMYNMSRGWMRFVKGNKLQPGTNLLFEYVPGSDNVVKVTTVV